MNVKIDKSFEKDTNKITDSKSLQKLAIIINQCVEANAIQEIQNLKKTKGIPKLLSYKNGAIPFGF